METPLYAALAALILIMLSINVIRGRRLFSAALGDGAGPEMTRRIRAQANFIEYTPIFLIMLGFAERGGIPGSSVPAGLTANGLPLGLQVLTKRWDEETMFRVCQSLEDAAGFKGLEPL